MKKLLSRFVATLSIILLIVVAITNLLIMIVLHKIIRKMSVKEKAVFVAPDTAKHKKEDK